MKVFEFSIEGNTDSDGDGAPDVTVSAEIFGSRVLGKDGKTVNLDLSSAMKLFGTLLGQTRQALGVD